MSYPPGPSPNPLPDDGARGGNGVPPAQPQGRPSGHPSGHPPGQQPSHPDAQHYPYATGGDADDRLPRRRPLWVVVVAVIAILSLVLAGFVAALNFLSVQRERQAAAEVERQQMVEADQVAEAFLADLEAHEQVWTTEAVEATHGPDVAGAFVPINLDAAELGEPAAALEQVCAEQAEATEAFEALAASTRPTLAEVPGTSDAYRSASSAAQTSERLAQAEQAYLDEGRELSEELLDHCRGWAQAALAIDAVAVESEDRRQGYLLSKGATQEVDNWVTECDVPEGCLPLDRAAREGLADAGVDRYSAMLDIKTAVFTEHCLEGYEAYCQHERDLAQAELDGMRTVMDHLRGPLGTGSQALPGYGEAVAAWEAEFEDLRDHGAQILIEMGTDIAPEVAGYYAAHQSRAVEAWQDRIAELAADTVQRSRADRA